VLTPGPRGTAGPQPKSSCGLERRATKMSLVPGKWLAPQSIHREKNNRWPSRERAGARTACVGPRPPSTAAPRFTGSDHGENPDPASAPCSEARSMRSPGSDDVPVESARQAATTSATMNKADLDEGLTRPPRLVRLPEPRACGDPDVEHVAHVAGAEGGVEIQRRAVERKCRAP